MQSIDIALQTLKILAADGMRLEAVKVTVDALHDVGILAYLG